jgi:hypothetical protein
MASDTNGNGAAPAIDERVEALRAEMRVADGGQGIDAYIIPSEDPHMVRPNLCDNTIGLGNHLLHKSNVKPCRIMEVP